MYHHPAVQPTSPERYSNVKYGKKNIKIRRRTNKHNSFIDNFNT